MKRITFFLIIIIAVASFLRLWNITSVPPGLYPDEAMNGNNALEALENGNFKIFYPENNGREGLFINIQAISLWLFGNKPWVLRLVSAIFGILTVMGAYYLTKELFGNAPPQIKNEIIALLTSFLLATSFWHINFSRIGFRAIMAPFFLTWSLYFLIRALSITKDYLQRSALQIQNSKFKIQNYPEQIPSELYGAGNSKFKIIIFSILGGIFYGLGFYSYISYRITPILILAILLYYWFKNKNREFRKKIILFTFYFLVSAFIIALPLGIYFLQNPQDFLGRTSQISVASSESPLKDFGSNILKTIGMFWVKGDSNWRHNFAGEPQLWWPVGTLFGLGILISIFRLLNLQFSRINFQSNSNDSIFKQNDLTENYKIGNSLEIGNWKLEIKNKNILPEVVLFSWLIIGLLPAIISSEGLPHALRSIIVIPPIMIISAVGLEWLISKTKNWLLRQKEKWPQYQRQLNRIEKEFAILLFLFLGAVMVNTYNQYFIRWAPNPNVYYAFNQNYVELGNYINFLTPELPKYVIINAEGVLVRGIPMPSQTVMFVTKSYLPEWQKEKNINYILPEEFNKIDCADLCAIAILEKDITLRMALKEKFKNAKIF